MAKDNGKGFFDKAQAQINESLKQAKKIAKDPDELDKLVDQSDVKLRNMDDKRANLKNLIRLVTTFSRMIRDYTSGKYTHLPWKSLLSIIVAVLYFINPLDIIPDFIPVIGLVDDLTLLAWIYKSIESDVEDYLAWKAEYEELAG